MASRRARRGSYGADADVLWEVIAGRAVVRRRRHGDNLRRILEHSLGENLWQRPGNSYSLLSRQPYNSRFRRLDSYSG